MHHKNSDKNILKEFSTSFCKILDRHCRYIIVSGFVAIASGRARGTEDIDVIIEKLSIERFSVLHKELVKAGFVCMQSDSPKIIYEDYPKKSASIRYTYKNHILPQMEVKFAKDYLDELQLEKRQKLELTGMDIWFGSINMNIAFKEGYLKSDKDMEDARHLRIVYSEMIDEGEIKEFKKLIRRYRL